MDAKRLTGPKAGSLKYDLLTALSVVGLHGPPVRQTSMLRLTALVTARYNWRLDEVSVGQRDLARMWGVNERTVKRQMKRLVDEAFLICKRKGVRGRVGAYRLNYDEIYRCSRPLWTAVGPDFEERMATFVPDVSTSVGDSSSGGTGKWRHVLQRLKADNLALYTNWYSTLSLEGLEAGVLCVKAPNEFVARYVETHLAGEMVRAVETQMGPVDRIVVQF